MELKKINNFFKNKKFKYSVIGVVILIIIIISLFFLFMPKIELKGKDEIVLDYPSNYKEPGFKARILNRDITPQVKVKGKVDDKKIGEYKIIYEIKYLFMKKNIVRLVKVIDSENPKLTLKGEENTKVCPGKEYQEEGFEAVDNYDGDLKDKVKVEKTHDKWIYKVTDSSSNETILERKFTYIDDNMPVIELVGQNTIYITQGSQYKEPGYKASDKCDGDITNKVTISGKVNINVPGIYELTYMVVDGSNNKTEVKRKVIVQRRKIYTGGSGTIYLTFDDGPLSGPTDKILNVLKEEGVKATFFVTCKGPDSLILREYREGHTIALHTATHNYAKIYASVDSYYNDLNQVSSRVKRITGLDSKIIRFPGGSSNTVSRRYQQGIMSFLTKDVLNRGYHYFDWNVDADDAVGCVKSASPSCVYNNVTRRLSKNRSNIVLMHDVKPYTANALRDIIKYAKNNGYTFKKIDMSTPMVWEKVNN